MNKFLLLVVSLSMYSWTVHAQTIKQDSLQIQFNPYANLRGHLAVYDKKSQLQDNASRLGATASFKKNSLTFLAATELHINLFQGGGSFNLDASGPGKFLEVSTTNNTQTFKNRLGYLGVDFEKYGRITFGKQWSVYYDITSYTDRFSIFGARASATYIGGTDGGENGTGRATQSLIYRNTFGLFSFGAQAQALGSNNNKFIDGYGFSGQLKINNKMTLGVAMNKTLLSDNLIKSKQVIGLRGQPSYYATGIKYQSKNLMLNAVGIIQKNGDFTKGILPNSDQTTSSPTVVFDAKGLEVYSNYTFNKFGINAGYNLYIPLTSAIHTDDIQPPINKDFIINDVIIGLSYHPIPFIKFYSEQRIAYGRSALGAKDYDVFTLGMMFNISKSFSHFIKN